jgi:hypothetical protein
LLLAGSAYAAGGASFNYFKQGADWGTLSKKANTKNWQCDEDQQSPIDLTAGASMKKVQVPNDIRRY